MYNIIVYLHRKKRICVCSSFCCIQMLMLYFWSSSHWIRFTSLCFPAVKSVLPLQVLTGALLCFPDGQSLDVQQGAHPSHTSGCLSPGMYATRTAKCSKLLQLGQFAFGGTGRRQAVTINSKLTWLLALVWLADNAIWRGRHRLKDAVPFWQKKTCENGLHFDLQYKEYLQKYSTTGAVHQLSRSAIISLWHCGFDFPPSATPACCPCIHETSLLWSETF